MFISCGITGEAGEIAEGVKKAYSKSDMNAFGKAEGEHAEFDLSEADRNAIIEEIGDLKYYIYCMQQCIGVSDKEVYERLECKLLKRSVNRLKGHL